MKKISIVCLLLIWFGSVVSAQMQNGNIAGAVADAEKAFAAAAAERGTNAAFVQFAAPDGLVFDTKPVNARASYAKRANTPALLSWRPAFYGISAAGDLGFTTGPWEYRPKGKTDQPTAFGEFATVWKKQPDGAWQFVLDMGIDHAKPEGAQPAGEQLYAPPAGKAKDSETNEYWRKLENDYAVSLQKNGARKTYDKFAAEAIRMLRQNHFAFAGKNAALDFLATENASLTVKTLGGGISSDLAYAYGEYNSVETNNKTEKGFFMRVWKREAKGWRIALDAAQPVPPAGK